MKTEKGMSKINSYTRIDCNMEYGIFHDLKTVVVYERMRRAGDGSTRHFTSIKETSQQQKKIGEE